MTRASGLWPCYDIADVDAAHPLVGAMAPRLRLDDGAWLADHAHTGRTFSSISLGTNDFQP